MELLKPFELASTAFPKMYRHSKLTSFTKQVALNFETSVLIVFNSWVCIISSVSLQLRNRRWLTFIHYFERGAGKFRLNSHFLIEIPFLYSDLIPKIDREQVIPKKKVSTPERQLDKTQSDEKYQHYPVKYFTL